MELLCGTLAVLAVVTVVGHGIWLLLAFFLRLLAGDRDRTPAPSRRDPLTSHCPGCDARIESSETVCPFCRLGLDSPRGRELRDIAGTLRLLRALTHRDDLDRDTADRLADLLRLRHQDLLGPPPAPPTPAAKAVRAAPAAPVPPMAAEVLDVLPVEPPPAPTPVEPPPPPAKPLTAVLSSFMEERNILWGELVGGLLIVGCSIALVLSLWQTLATVPYFPFLIFAALTSALFAAGQYTLHHWKLASTSRGLLLISLLLVPLNLLVLANLSTDQPIVNAWLDGGVAAVAFALFAGLVVSAGRDLIGTDLLPGPLDRRWLLAVGVLAPPACALLAPHLDNLTDMPYFAAGASLLVAAAVLGGFTLYGPRSQPLSLTQANALFTFLGVGSFAVLVTFLHLTLHHGNTIGARLLDVPLVLAGIPGVALGLLVVRRLGDDEPMPARIAGTCVTLAGLGLMLVGTALAWPHALPLAVTLGLTAVVLGVAAFAARTPWTLAAAVPAAALAVVLGVGLMTQGPRAASAAGLTELITAAPSAAVLALLTLAFTGLATRLRGAFVEHGTMLGNSAVVVGLGALAVASYQGIERPVLATIVYALTAVALLVRAAHDRQAWWFTGFQLVLTGATAYAVTAIAQHYAIPHDVRLVHAHCLGLGVLALGWVAARKWWPGPLWQAFEPGVDRLTLGGLVVVALGLAIQAAGAGVLTEYNVAQLADLSSDLPYQSGPLAYLVSGLLGVALLTVLIQPKEDDDRLRWFAQLGLGLMLVSLPLLYAGSHTWQLAGASAARWGLAAAFVVGSALLWTREPLARLARACGLAPAETTHAGYALFTLAAGGVVVLTAVLTSMGFRGEKLAGPVAESVFAQMGARNSSIIPLLFVVAGLVGTAVRERWTAHAFAAGLLASVSVMGGYALGVVQAGERFYTHEAVFAGLLGCLVSAIGSLVWMAGRRRVGGGPALAVHASLGLLGVCALSLLFALVLLFGPGAPGTIPFPTLSGPVGWAALLLGTAAAVGYCWVANRSACIHPIGLFVLAAGLFAGNSASLLNTPTLWVAYHVVLGVWACVAVAVTAGGSFLPLRAWEESGTFPGTSLRGWMVALGAVMTLVAGRWAHATDVYPQAPPLATLTASVLLGAVALWYLRGGYTYASGLLFTLAVYVGWVAWKGDEDVHGWLLVATGLATSATFWWAIEMPWLRRGETRLRWPGIGYAPLATFGSLALVVGVATVAVFGVVSGQGTLNTGAFGWAAVATVAVALGLAVQAGRTTLGLAGLWTLGLAAEALAVLAFKPSVEQLTWVGPLALATHTAIVGLVARLWQVRVAGPSGAITALGLPNPVIPDRQWAWLLPAQVTVGCLAVSLGLNVAVSQLDLPHRLLGPLAVALLVPAAYWLGRAMEGARAEEMRLTMLGLGVLTLGAVAWAVPEGTSAVAWLTRNAWLAVVLTGCAVAGLETLHRWQAGRRLALGVGALAFATTLVVLGQMLPLFDPATKRTPLDTIAVIALVLALVAQVVTAVRLAVLGDPWGHAERGRMAYVYLAEFVVLLLFFHVRLNVPELFVGALAKYWTVIVVTIAFAGVGVGEWAERRGLRVLAVPLTQTGVFLPLVPILAFWARPPQALLHFAENHAPGMSPFLNYLVNLPWRFEAHAGIWFLTSVLYALLAVARRSRGWALVAALAANFGLWALLMHVGVSFFLHPQAWLIPLAIILLVAEHLHRDQLRPDLAGGLRYLGISLIYVASTADLFLVGLGQSLWLPVVLAVLCVAGVLAGILLRVRAFLYLGVGFLLVDLFTMIWHAAVQQSHTWVWWLSGIVLGVAILALFALFEKRRNDVLHLLEQLRTWD